MKTWFRATNVLLVLAIALSAVGPVSAGNSSLQLYGGGDNPDGVATGQTTYQVFYDQTFTFSYASGPVCLSSQTGLCIKPAIDDEVILFVNGVQVLDQLSYAQEFDAGDLSSHMQVGDNQIRVQLIDRVGPSQGGSALWLVAGGSGDGGGGGPCDHGAYLLPFGQSVTFYHTHLDGPVVVTPYDINQLYYDADITGDHCPEAAIQFNPTMDPSFTLNSIWGAVTVHQSGELDSVPNPQNDRRLPLFGTGVTLNPPSLTIYEYWNRTANWQDFDLKTEQTIGNKYIPLKPDFDLRYVVSLSTMTAKIMVLYGTAVLIYIAPRLEQLLQLVAASGLVPLRMAAEAPPSNRATLGMPTKFTSPGPEVITDLNQLFGPEFVGMSTLNLLKAGTAIKGPGQNIRYSAAGFTPNGRVYVALYRVGDAKPTLDTEVRADAQGAINGIVRLPQNAQPGRWLTVAVDTQSLRQQLQALAHGESTALNPFLAANTTIVPNYITVKVDIKPGSPINPVDLRSQGVIPTAVLSSKNFNALLVAPATVQFGPDAAPTVNKSGQRIDANHDHLQDMMLHFRTQQTGILSSDQNACLFGQTTTGTYFFGCDSIKNVPAKP